MASTKTKKPKDVEVVKVAKKTVDEPKLTRVMATLPFYDLESKCNRGRGAQWDVTAERLEQLQMRGLVVVL